jgi:secondary thiamine-phosphate synthase enzyme
MRSEEIDVRTGDRLVTDLTQRAVRFCAGAGDGLLSVFVPHATAGVALIETGAGSETDLATALEHVLPADDRWVHRHGSPGHGRDHVMPAFVSSSLVVPVIDGVMVLGTWQSVVLVDPNVDNPRRRVRFSLLAG